MNKAITFSDKKRDIVVKRVGFRLFLTSMLFFGSNFIFAQQTQTILTTTSTSPFTVPSDISRMRIELWGGGGAGGGVTNGNNVSGGGGAGGSYTRGASNVTPASSITFTVGAGGAGVSNGQGGAGGTSTFNSPTVLSAVGGAGGLTNVSINSGAPVTVGVTLNGGAGGNGTNGGGSNSSGGGGGGAGSTASGGNATGATAGAGGLGDGTGTGGTGRAGQSTPGTPLAATGIGAGGAGARNTNSGSTARAGGAGSSGQIRLTYYLYSITGTTASSPICAGGSSTVNVTASAIGLPTGNYTVTYNLSGANSVTGATSSMTVTTAGSGSFTISSGFVSGGATTITITNLQNTDFGSRITANNTASITVIPSNTASAPSSTPTTCPGTAITTVTHTTTGATGIGIPTGLPSGVSAVWSSNTITISGTPTISGTYNYSIPLTGGCGSVNATGTITVTGTTSWVGTTSSAWNDVSNWSCGLPSATNNIIISTSSPNAPVLNVDFTLGSGKTLTLSGTGSLTIGSQSNLTIDGNADFGGKSVTILSDATGTGAIGQVSGSLNNATNVTVERYIPLGKRAFRFLTPGVTTTEFISGSWQEATHITGSTTGAGGFDATVSGSPSMYTYNNTVASGTGWTAIPNTNATNLEAGMGYRILIRGDRTPSLLTSASAANMNTAVTLSATGALRVGQVVMNVSSTPAINNTTNTTTNGFSLVGNPYVCSVDWHAVSRSGLLDTYYAWDANMGTSSQRGRYVAYSVATGFNSMGNSGSSQVGRYIQPGQAFFVRNTTLGTPGTLTFDENDKADTYTSVFRTQQSYNDVTTFSKLGLLVYEPNELALGSSPIDGAVAFFGSDFTNAIDAGDVEKLESAGENVAWFNSNQKLAMATMSPVAATDELMLKTLRFTANKSYTFKFETSDFDASVSAFLVDQYLNTQTPIALNEDAFVTFTTTTDVQSYGENRFKVVFDVNALGNVNFESFVSLYPNPANGNLFYLNLPTWDENTSVVLYNALGQQIPVIAGEIDGMARQYNVPANLTKGVYYVKVAQNGKEATKKWIVNN
ncbi:glycine-rich domain-containing protein [Flavobacterium sedimenticola]|uniref:T9SS type A sorting domain-containing protein n=1 Tax=Flavobacterium sedimenticola TaxID=3043286 RepID=A0ABT6XR27_9FLAO|nr:T9SS type A sorting domain-containing protein [Flavobacterium sedimenticola]MDI9257478.1 T9SS type A sorting domain-containing protein [Flavobacterium sedimenticola]